MTICSTKTSPYSRQSYNSELYYTSQKLYNEENEFFEVTDLATYCINSEGPLIDLKVESNAINQYSNMKLRFKTDILKTDNSIMYGSFRPLEGLHCKLTGCGGDGNTEESIMVNSKKELLVGLSNRKENNYG